MLEYEIPSFAQTGLYFEVQNVSAQESEMVVDVSSIITTGFVVVSNGSMASVSSSGTAREP